MKLVRVWPISDSEWQNVLPGLLRFERRNRGSMDAGRYTPAYVLDMLRRGVFELRRVISEGEGIGWVIGRKLNGADLACYFIWWLEAPGIGRDGLRELVASLRALARSLGCGILEFSGRPGWQRILSGVGVELEERPIWTMRAKS